jgi:WD40 repeat protein
VRASPKLKSSKANETIQDDDDAEEMDILELFGEEPEKVDQAQKAPSKVELNTPTDEEIDRRNDKIEHVYLASVSDDGSLRIWKPIESDSLLSLEKHNSSVNSVCLNSSDMLATASSDKSINMWNMKPFFSKVSSGSHVVSSEKANRTHLSEITSLVTTKKHVISGSLDGMVFVWNIKYEEDNSTVSGIEYAYDIQAHDRSVTSICITNDGDESNETKFVTCSTDKFIKVWLLRQDKHGQVTLALEEVLALSKPVIFMNTAIFDNKMHLFVIESANGALLSGRFLKCSGEKLQFTKGGFNLSHCTLLATQIKIAKNSNQLYINLLHDEILKINLNNCFKVWGTYQLSKQSTDFTRVSSVTRSETDFDTITNYSKNNKHFYTSVEYNADDVQLIAGDSKGLVYIQNSYSSPLCEKKHIHSDSITELLSFKLHDSTSGDSVGRTLSASKDGYVRIWSSDFNTQMGQFNNRSGGIAKIVQLDSADRPTPECSFVFGDQMGNVNLIKWHQSF